jgi:hypothetical protein
LCAIAGCQASPPPPLPTPLFAPRFIAQIAGARTVDNVCVETPGIDGMTAARITAVLLATGVSVATSGRCRWLVRFGETVAELPDDALAVASEDQGFAFHNDLDGDVVTTSVQAASARAALYAARSIADFAVPAGAGKRTLLAVTVADAPAFKMRGVIEGFYGPPYADGDRTTLLEVMGELRQNTFVYAPQNDAYAAANWFQLYDDADAQPLAHAVAVAAAENIDFVYGMRPGQSMFYPSTQPIRYASDDDFATLTAKLDQVRGWGVTQFGIFFDDAVPELQDATDLATFDSLADAQAYLLNRVDDYLRSVAPNAQLYTVGTHYSSADAEWQPYSEALTASLHPTVPVMWTGEATYSTAITAADLTPVAQALGGAPIIWDNWPQKIVGLDGRSADVATAARGFLSNAVLSSWQHNPLEAFLEVLGTIGCYTWTPATYQPDAAWDLWNAELPAILDGAP